jgi:hypothetical protein
VRERCGSAAEERLDGGEGSCVERRFDILQLQDIKINFKLVWGCQKILCG